MSSSNQYCIYILTNVRNTVLYTGVTYNLKKRTWEHKNHIVVKGFTSKYNVNKLVYYEVFGDIDSAINREKQLKGGSRIQKIQLIERMNPNWQDFYDTLD